MPEWSRKQFGTLLGLPAQVQILLVTFLDLIMLWILCSNTISHYRDHWRDQIERAFVQPAGPRKPEYLWIELVTKLSARLKNSASALKSIASSEQKRTVYKVVNLTIASTLSAYLG